LELRYRFEVGNDFDATAVAYRHDFHRVWGKINGFRDVTPIADVLQNPTGRRRVLHDILTGEADSTTPEEALVFGTNDRTFVSQGVQVESKFRAGNESLKNEV